MEVQNLEKIPHNDQTSCPIESLPIKEPEYTSQIENEPIEQEHVSIDNVNEEVTNDYKKNHQVKMKEKSQMRGSLRTCHAYDDLQII